MNEGNREEEIDNGSHASFLPNATVKVSHSFVSICFSGLIELIDCCCNCIFQLLRVSGFGCAMG